MSGEPPTQTDARAKKPGRMAAAHTCAPQEPVICERPHQEERIDAATGEIADVPG